ncbi:aquaporin [Streptomyces sp. TRM66268-LWL]|uniref:Aquaporin n=1 Tax=Streptomyces polyasparticus TaxID=2767826 RepID=A0ABR7SYD3_9ACTN|nr:aquaporin [Streptomyces polyasparticus]MBC9719561.1 aquaporin [Streptomyces polyasparticus]
MRAIVTEFVGTLFLVLVITTSGVVETPLAPIAIGGVLAAMIFAGGHISGAHYNPAVTVAVCLRRRISPKVAGGYIAAQILGGLAGALLAALLTRDIQHSAVPLDASALSILTGELLMTFALAYVVLNVATSKSHPNNSFYGVAIGLTVMAGAIVVGPITGGAFNPAVALAGAVSSGLAWGNLWLYGAAALVGGAGAALLFRVANPDDV